MATTLVFPDLHQATNMDVVERLIETVAPDTTVFLGDYFDQFYDDDQDAKTMALWLDESVKKEGRIHLIGNHDLHYLDRFAVRCSGWTAQKHAAIESVISKGMLDKLKFFAEVDGWILTHAGLSQTAAEAYGIGKRSVSEFLNDEDAKARDVLASNVEAGAKRHWFWGASSFRGGTQENPGILWCDFREFTPIAGVNQLFGHTLGSRPRVVRHGKWSSHCIDTTTSSGVQTYAIIRDGKITILDLKFNRSTRSLVRADRKPWK